MEDLDTLAESAAQETDPFQGEGIYSRESYSWAIDVFWVFENLGTRMTRQKAKTAARWALWKVAKQDTMKFVDQVVPKAMTLLEKARAKQGDDTEIVQAERKSISELKQLLQDAIVEATEG